MTRILLKQTLVSLLLYTAALISAHPQPSPHAPTTPDSNTTLAHPPTAIANSETNLSTASTPAIRAKRALSTDLPDIAFSKIHSYIWPRISCSQRPLNASARATALAAMRAACAAPREVRTSDDWGAVWVQRFFGGGGLAWRCAFRKGTPVVCRTDEFEALYSQLRREVGVCEGRGLGWGIQVPEWGIAWGVNYWDEVVELNEACSERFNGGMITTDSQDRCLLM